MWRAVLYALALHAISLPVTVITSSLWRRIAPRTRYLHLPGFRTLRRANLSKPLRLLLPSTILSADHRVALKNPSALEDLAGHWDVYVLIAIDSVGEELSYRGVPLTVAVWLDGSPLIAVLFGTLLWASLHPIRVIPKTVLTGALYAWLWLSGAWYLAVALHVGVNVFGHSLCRAEYWSDHGRYPHRSGSDA